MNPIPHADLNALAADIKLLVLDVDGVLTDGQLYYIDGQECKAFHSRDGLGIALLLRAGIEVAIISGNESVAVNARFAKFGLKHLYQGVSDKALQFTQILDDLQLSPQQVAYLGDDLIDLPVMCQVGLACAVADGDEFVKSQAQWISRASGGRGAVRELCEFILTAQGQLSELQHS